MALLLPVVWLKYDVMFPSMVNEKGTRLYDMVQLLLRAVPAPVDMMGTLLLFSHGRHMCLSQKIGTIGHPLHLFAFDEEAWKNLMGYLASVPGPDEKKPRVYSSASILAEKKLPNTKAVVIPPGTSKEKVTEIIAAAQAELDGKTKPGAAADAAPADTPSTPTATPPSAEILCAP